MSSYYDLAATPNTRGPDSPGHRKSHSPSTIIPYWARKDSFFPYGVPRALTYDEELQKLPEPERTDFQIMVDEKVEELVQATMA